MNVVLGPVAGGSGALTPSDVEVVPGPGSRADDAGVGPNQLWHLDMTNSGSAEHGWCFLNGIVDCCTHEVPGSTTPRGRHSALWMLSLTEHQDLHNATQGA